MLRQLTDLERQQLYAATRLAYLDSGSHARTARRIARRQLKVIGWETILITIVLPIIMQLITEWIKNKLTAEQIPSAMPATFAADPVEVPS